MVNHLHTEKKETNEKKTAIPRYKGTKNKIISVFCGILPMITLPDGLEIGIATANTSRPIQLTSVECNINGIHNRDLYVEANM